jgi:hypothetical protein
LAKLSAGRKKRGRGNFKGNKDLQETRTLKEEEMEEDEEEEDE